MCMYVCVFVFAEVSTKLVSEYKTKLQISEAENNRLEGMVCMCALAVGMYMCALCVCMCVL